MNFSVIGKQLPTLLQSLIRKSNYRTIGLALVLILLAVTVRMAAPYYLEEVPSRGGSFTEGMVGYPRFVNPVLALSQTDKDLTRLIFSGLFQVNRQGQITTDLAQSYTVNDSATEYTVLLRPDIAFHDGSPITTKDVAYTLSLIRDPIIKSPLFPRLQGLSWEVADERTITFTLSGSNPNFLDILTVGIVSKDQWEEVSLEEFPFASANINPIGSGPYAIDSINRDSNQRIQSYILRSSSDYHTPAYIKEIEAVFYSSQDAAITAFESGLVDNLANIGPRELLKLDRALANKEIQSFPLRRSFNLFFNTQNNQLLGELEMRKIIQESIDKEAIIEQVLLSRAEIATGPLPPTHDAYLPPEKTNTSYNIDKINEAFESAGYTRNEAGDFVNASSTPLVLSLHTPQSEELEAVAQLVAQDLEELGLTIEIVTTPSNQIINEVVRMRKFDLLLFGQLVRDANSLYSFYHSSQIGDPGINIAGFANQTVDAILERLVDPSTEADQRQTDYHNLQEVIRDQVAAVFIYHPHFIYATDTKIKNNSVQALDFAWDRFNGVVEWYSHTESLLPWFAPNN